MRIFFFDRDADALTSSKKGELFERLTRRLVEQSGYSAITLRVKHSSLEYDIEGQANLSGRPLSGEAKAQDAKISGQVIAAFVGKLLPLATSTPGGIDGLFISTSPLTAEAVDYLASLAPQSAVPGFTLRTLVGDEIHRFLADHVPACADEETLRSRARALTGLEPQDVWLGVSDGEDFILASCGPNAVASATHFTTLRLDGSDLVLPERLMGRLRRQLPDVQALTYAGSQVALADRPSATSLPSIATGADWFDYKFPTPPEYFIGRDAALGALEELVTRMSSDATAARAIQVLSRSGVGKSSLLVRVPAVLPHLVTATVDGRNLRVPGDVRLAIAQLATTVADRLATSASVPRSQDDIQGAMVEIASQLEDANSMAVLQIDQFESVLATPAVFDAVLDVVATATSRRLPLALILARKNDLAATFDDGATIDLARLNDLSTPILLEDFSPDESRSLLFKLADEIGEPVAPEMGEALLTFSAGFPWLLKRLCAHVRSLRQVGVNQRQMLQSGLRADDLFHEDLAGLSEPDKALLRTVAAHLPSTASELSQRLESEVSPDRLTSKLNEFLGHKLLRLSGNVYDTYNDVFKTYLVTERIPFQARYVFRSSPGACLRLLREVARLGPMDLSGFQQKIGGNRIVVLNKLRELRLLGLAEAEPGYVGLTLEATRALQDDTLGEYLRRALRGNGLVIGALDLLGSQDTVTVGEIAELLQNELPHVDATDQTWQQYAQQLVNWLRFGGLVHQESGAVRLRDAPGDELLQRRQFLGGSFTADSFIPSNRPPKLAEFLESLRAGPMSRAKLVDRFGTRDIAGLIRDAEALEIVQQEDDTIAPGRQGRLILERTTKVDVQDLAPLALSKPNVRALLDALSDRPLSDDEQRAVLTRFGSTDWTDSTWRWRLGILRAWLVATGQARSSRLGLVSA